MISHYKVTNISDIPVPLDLNKSLLTRQEREEYYEFKNSNEYLGYSAEERAIRKRRPEAEKGLPFFNSLDKGIRTKAFIPRGDGSKDIGERKAIVLAPDWELTKKKNIKELIDLCNFYFIPYSKIDTRDSLVSKLRKVIGDERSIVLTDEPEKESGSSQLDNVERYLQQEIKQQLEPGQSSPTITKIGLLTAEYIAPESELGDENIDVKYDKSSLAGLTYKELQQLAKENGLPHVGVKQDKLVSSLLNI